MTRWNKIFLLFILVFFSTKGLSQNLFDEPNVLKFANFLYSTHQYKFASEEFERLTILNPYNFEYKLKVIRSYRLSENYQQAEIRIKDYANDSLNNLSGPLALEYLKIKLLTDNYSEARQYLNINHNLDIKTKNIYTEYLYLLSKNWIKADSVNRQAHPLDSRYDKILIEAGKINYKSPFISGTFSAIIPGLGKVYTGDWKDGAIAFVFVTANAYQSYRGFSTFGVHNANGWIFGSFALGFYLGNIYGSVKAAIKHNKTSNEYIYSRAKIYIDSDFK